MNTINSIPKVYLSEDLQKRCFVYFSYQGKRHRIYNGKELGLSCNPAGETTIEGRQRELNRLLEATRAAMQAGRWQFVDQTSTPVVLSVPVEMMAGSVIKRQQEQFDKQDWSVPYLRDMNRVTNELLAFLATEGLAHSLLEEITKKVLNRFLDNYRSSGRYYMNKRRNLSALFYRLAQDEELTLTGNPVRNTHPMKTKETLNEAYTPEQLTGVLAYLEVNHPNLYLCALMTYGTLLRPHREIRLLRRKDFDAGLNVITLTGSATKSGRIRKVPVPEYIRQVLIRRRVDALEPDAFIFTSIAKPVNADYFTTAWSRQKQTMLKLGLVQPDQTLYSFRHSAAVYCYTDRQNLRLLQQIMGHSTPDVTTKYLRSLGVMEVNPDDMPRLPGS
ncbi:tyrosine-type recombinase/integrase [Spirosoma linguale]|uniref:Integrase family protein n=1 Tax=Spirosoma linguale (strain ATCC 33905 / DSM 74 / LMG 10896 / Claus 1) TaxID=504472 RepID=D2QTI7_SPILD|nr:integrase family protein [Spirosoma linguale DSM 74]